MQEDIICSLYSGNHVAYDAPSGSMKNVILCLLAQKEHSENGKQTLITAEAYLQENVLVLADRLGLKGGVITESMESFLRDFKKEKYDIIFVSYDFFENPKNLIPFLQYFSDRIRYWGIDLPTSKNSVWPQVNSCAISLEVTKYLMSKAGFEDIDLKEYKKYKQEKCIDIEIVSKYTLYSEEEKIKWLAENLNNLQGQGIVYCNDEIMCKQIAKQLRKNKIMAEAYVDVNNPQKSERTNYLTNSFCSGGLPVLVTQHEIGKNLSNSKIRFILHYDLPNDKKIYNLHVSQIGKLADSPRVFDLDITSHKIQL